MKLNRYVLQRDYCIESPDDVEESEIVDYLALLIRTARIGGITKEESDLLRLVEDALGCDGSVVLKAADLARDDEKTSLEALIAGVGDAAMHACVYRDAYRLALADGTVSSAEDDFLAEMAGKLGLSANAAKSIRQLVDEDAALQRKFGELLSKGLSA